jgi:hypothetical protein
MMPVARSERQPPGSFPKVGQSCELPQRNEWSKDHAHLNSRNVCRFQPRSLGWVKAFGLCIEQVQVPAAFKGRWARTEPLGANGRPPLFGARHAEAQEAVGL